MADLDHLWAYAYGRPEGPSSFKFCSQALDLCGSYVLDHPAVFHVHPCHCQVEEDIGFP